MVTPNKKTVTTPRENKRRAKRARRIHGPFHSTSVSVDSAELASSSESYQNSGMEDRTPHGPEEKSSDCTPETQERSTSSQKDLLNTNSNGSKERDIKSLVKTDTGAHSRKEKHVDTDSDKPLESRKRARKLITEGEHESSKQKGGNKRITRQTRNRGGGSLDSFDFPIAILTRDDSGVSTKVYEMRSRQLVLGRSQVNLNFGEDVADTHCSIAYDAGSLTFLLRNFGESGTWINGQKHTSDAAVFLPKEATLTLGSSVVHFKTMVR